MGGDHDLTLAVVGEEVVSDRVGLAGGTVTIKIDGALAVEVGGRLVMVEVGKECLLPVGVAPVGAVGRRRRRVP
jgi:hypothetical protein